MTSVFKILDILQLKQIDDCENINSVNPLYLYITHVNGYIEGKGVNKYFLFDAKDESKKLLKKYKDIFNGIRDEIKTINGGKENDYKKNYMKNKFNSDDDLPLNKP